MKSLIHALILVTVYPKKYAHGFCFAVLCCGYTLTDFPISIRLTSLALWQSNDCPSASKATLMNMDKYFMWIHYERLHNHNKAKHNKTLCIFLGIYCTLCHWRGSLRIDMETVWWAWSVIVHTIRFDVFIHCSLYIKTAISQMRFCNALSSMKTVVFRLIFHGSVFTKVQLMICQHWCDWWLGTEQATRHYLNTCWARFITPYELRWN